MKVRKKYIAFLLILTISFAFLQPVNLKEAAKNLAIASLDRVALWKKIRDIDRDPKYVVDEQIVLEQDPIIFTEKLIYKRGEKIVINLLGRNEFQLEVNYVNPKDLEKNIISRYKIQPRGSIPTVYSTLSGIQSTDQKIILDASKLPNGWINIVASNKETILRQVPVFIEEDKNSQIYFVDSTDTLLAYNPAHDVYGIPNYYSRLSNLSHSASLPKNMPIEYKQIDSNTKSNILCSDHLINSDILQRNNLYKLGINHSTMSDAALDDYSNLEGVKVLILGTHNEYWTKQKAINIKKFVKKGGKLLILGGNNAWREVYRIQNSNRIFHGEGLRDDNDFNTLAEEILGSYYSREDYNSYAPYKTKNSQYWKKYFDIDIEEGEDFAIGTNLEHCKDLIFGGSGHETDKIIPNSKGFVELAKGKNKNGGASIVYKEFPGGGKVLNFGSLSTWHSLDDKILNKLIKTFVNK